MIPTICFSRLVQQRNENIRLAFSESPDSDYLLMMGTRKFVSNLMKFLEKLDPERHLPVKVQKVFWEAIIQDLKRLQIAVRGALKVLIQTQEIESYPVVQRNEFME